MGKKWINFIARKRKRKRKRNETRHLFNKFFRRSRPKKRISNAIWRKRRRVHFLFFFHSFSFHFYLCLCEQFNFAHDVQFSVHIACFVEQRKDPSKSFWLRKRELFVFNTSALPKWYLNTLFIYILFTFWRIHIFPRKRWNFFVKENRFFSPLMLSDFFFCICKNRKVKDKGFIIVWKK